MIPTARMSGPRTVLDVVANVSDEVEACPFRRRSGAEASAAGGRRGALFADVQSG